MNGIEIAMKKLEVSFLLDDFVGLLTFRIGFSKKLPNPDKTVSH